MIILHSCNPAQRGKPAAKCIIDYRLRHATASLFGGRFAPPSRPGFTLVEVLVAMAILLVGIWALAVGFPKLLGVIALEERRTEMARQAQRTLDELTRNAQDLPLAICGDRRLPHVDDPTVTTPEGIDANLSPADPDIGVYNITVPNSRDDMIEIIGERFTVPAPLAPPFAGATPIYVFRQGLAEGWVQGTDPELTGVRREVGLPDDFTIHPDYTVTFAGADFVEISYEWVDTAGYRHHVHDELVQTGGEVYAASVGNFDGIVDGSTYGIGLIEFIVEHTDALPAVDRQATQHPSGALLRFHQNDVGARLRVSYILRAGPRPLEPNSAYRRGLIMTEEHRIISRPQIITLVGSHIDDEVLLPVDLDGNGLYDDTCVLAVDLNTGQIYDLVDLPDIPGYFQGLEFAGDDGAAAGRVQISADPASLGHDVRFYYATLDQDLVTIQIAPQTFMDWNVVDAAGQDWLLYRSYLAVDNPDDSAYRDLLFYPCNAGHTVAVDYKWDDGGTVTTVNGEMHAISTEPYGSGSHYITLFYPNVEEIIAVRGESVNARAWWRAPNGRLEKLDIVTVR